MSTRCVLAVTKGNSWEGVYVHGSGYPEEMGPEIWTTLHSRHQGDVAAFTDAELTAHSGGYSTYPDNCYCHVLHDDAGPMRYTAEDEADNAAFDIEWVYVVGRHVLTVFKSVPTGCQERCENQAGRWWMQDVYRWAQVEQIDLTKPEPDWAEVEARGRRLLAATVHGLGQADEGDENA